MLNGIKNIISAVIGLALIVLGLFLLLNPPQYDYTVTGEISKIEVTGGEWVEDANGFPEYQDTYTVYVSYEFNGKTVTDAELSSYSSSMKVGDSIEIAFNADDTAHVSEPDLGFMPIIAIVLGVVFAATGVIGFVRSRRT